MIIIIVYKLNNNLIKIAKKEYAFFFPNSESLTRAVLFIMNKTPKTALQSALYFYNGNYILILKALNNRIISAINEFCFHKTQNEIKIELIEEHGKPIITNNAIKRYGVAFLKD